MRDLPSGTVTFLFTDIEGSTKLLHELGPDGYAEALAHHRRILRTALTEHSGIEVDTQGDAFFVAFPRADEALSAAERAQRDLATGRIRVRMGLHSGEPTLTDEGYVGIDVHKGARIAAAAHGAQVILSGRTKELAGSRFSFLDLGEHRLKDLDEPVWIYQLGEERFPPLKTLSNTNLPAMVSSFVGRAAELQDAVERLEGTRLLTVVGPGGAGKTRFAIELASQCVTRFPNGVFWVPLAPVRDPALVDRTIGQTIGASNGSASHIAHKHMLLVLDNFEQIVDAAPSLSSLLSLCPNLKIVVTSRETLRIDGEQEFPLPPLSADEGVELFHSRAVTASFDDVGSLVRRLDGLPLAIELAAARSKLFTIPQLIDALGHRLDAFKGGRGVDPRQQTLRATIQWSYDLLIAGEQTTFARLAAFSGGFTLEAAAQVAASDPDTLQSLLEKSMIRRTEDRFEMLETIREFALERFEAEPDGEAIRRRHAEYYLALAEASDIPPDASDRHILLLDSEQGNLRAALSWATGGGDAAIGLRLAGALWRFWWNHGAVKEGAAWYEAALATGADQPEELRALAIYGAANMALARDDPLVAIDLLEQALVTFRSANDDFRIMRCLNDLGIALQMKGDHARARPFYEDALALAERVGDGGFVGSVRVNLSDLALAEGRLDDAIEILDELIGWSRSAGYVGVIGAALGNRALAWFLRGDLSRAGEDARNSLIVMREVGEFRQQAHTLVLGAGVLARRGDRVRALHGLAVYAAANQESGLVIGAQERTIYEETLARLQAEMEPAEFEAAWAEGYRTDHETALDHLADALE